MAFRLTKPPEVNAAFQGQNIFTYILQMIANAILGVGAPAGPLTSIMSHLAGIRGNLATNNNLIASQGQQLQDLSIAVDTGTTTPIWASTGGKDLVTFPDTMMQRLYYENESSSNEVTKIPSFKPGKRVADFAFIRGGRDSPTPLEAVRIITGDDAGLIDISAWYIGIYVFNGSVMAKIWDSGNIANQLTKQRQRYHIGTGMTQMAQNNQLYAIASLQIAPGALQGTRSLGCIFQTGISEQTGTVPQARHAYVAGLDTLPAGIAFSTFTYDKNKIMWGAIGASAT